MVPPGPEHSVSTTSHRKIIHIDMDAFYASVEQRDNPDLRGKPVAVGGSAERGVVAAASYEARQYGVRSAMPSVTAKRQCPDLIFVKPRFEVYKAISRQIREIFAEHTPIIEPLSLDEAYLDVTENLQGILLARDIAVQIREKIKAETGLNASAGISYNKFLAKLASDHRKPNGQYVISPGDGTGLRRDATGREVSRNWAGNRRQTQRLRDLDWPRHSQPVPRLPTGELWQVRYLLLLDFARHRRAPCTRQSHPQIGRRREHVLCRPR